MLAHAQTLRNLRNWVTSLGELMHRVPLEVVAKIGFAHDGLLASSLGKKASANLETIHKDTVCAARSAFSTAFRKTFLIGAAFTASYRQGGDSSMYARCASSICTA